MKNLAIDLLKKAAIFSSLSKPNLQKLAELLTVREYPTGANIFSEGDAGESVMLIASGVVEIVKKSSTGEDDILLAERGTGEIFGEMALIENSPRFADARAKSVVSLFVLQKNDFEHLLGENPSVTMEIMGTLSSKLRQADLQMIKDLERKNRELEGANKSLTKLAEELRKSNSDLVRAKEFRDKIINNAPFFMIISDGSGRINIMNESAERIFGITIDEARGKPVSEIIKPSENHDVSAEVDHSLMARGIWGGELMTKASDGSQTIIDITVVNIASGGGDNEGPAILYMGRDVTEEKHMQRRAFQLERKATRGEMAAEIAHELNNFLAIVSGNLELLVMDLNKERYDKITKKTTSMKEGIGRISKFVEGLMSVGRPEARMEIFDIHQFIDSELFFLKPQPKFKDLEFVCHWGKDVPSIEMDRGQLQQVLFNLLNNSADALAEIPPGNRVVTIETAYNSSDDKIILSLYDNGCGMSDEDYGRVFRQHFTTKKTGHGFGLLAVKRVVKAHGGRISVAKGPEGGACFSIELPRRIPVKKEKVAEPQS